MVTGIGPLSPRTRPIHRPRTEGSGTGSGQQVYRPGPLDLARYLPVHLGGDSGHPTRKDLPRLRGELGKNLGILVADVNHLKVKTLTRHPLVCLPKGNPTLLGFGLAHNRSLAEFTVKRPALEIIVELHLLQATRRPQALFVTGGRVAGWLLALRFRFGALKNDDIARHGLRKGPET